MLFYGTHVLKKVCKLKSKCSPILEVLIPISLIRKRLMEDEAVYVHVICYSVILCYVHVISLSQITNLHNNG